MMQMLFVYTAGMVFLILLMVINFFNSLLGPSILTWSLNAPTSYILTFLLPGSGMNVMLKMLFS